MFSNLREKKCTLTLKQEVGEMQPITLNGLVVWKIKGLVLTIQFSKYIMSVTLLNNLHQILTFSK